MLFQRSPFLGLLNFDVLYIITNILLIPFYLALYAALKSNREAMVITALVLGLVGLAIYFPSNTAFEMLKLSEQYPSATTEVQRSILLAEGQMLLAQLNGTAYVVYYLLSAIAVLLFSAAMLQSKVFSRNTAYAGISAGILMLVPSSLGMIGLIFAFVSLLPWAIFSILVSRTLFQLGRNSI